MERKQIDAEQQVCNKRNMSQTCKHTDPQTSSRSVPTHATNCENEANQPQGAALAASPEPTGGRQKTPPHVAKVMIRRTISDGAPPIACIVKYLNDAALSTSVTDD